MARNARLERLLVEAGFVDRDGQGGRKQFARAVTGAAVGRGSTRTYSHTYVSRWLDGVVPRDDQTREAIREALSARLGRRIAPDELGFISARSTSPDVGLSYPDEPAAGITSVAQLFEADLTSAPGVGHAPTNNAAWNDASLSWLVGSQQPLEDLGRGGRVGPADVERLRTMRGTFDRLDSMFGGGHARNALVQYLRTSLPPLLRAGGRTDIRQALFSAAGEATQLAAWMSYDAGLHGLAQRYFIQALGLADAGNDRLLGASILDAMSHQAAYLGSFRKAANLARAAGLGTASAGVPTLTSHFYAMEARALARLRDKSGCDRAMSAAVREYERRGESEAPEWISYFDDAELSAELGHCHRDLGRSATAIILAEQALDKASGDYVRSDFFVAMVLADAHLDAGDVEQGCQVAADAFRAGEGLESARCHGYVDEFKQRLILHKKNRAVRDFVATVRSSRLWTPERAG
ncbi:MAG: XRE family transcriptional regulator [Pseudonocardia sp.]|nr:XRE family transcriptional regulator [Pseudonocardia sp.]